MHGQDWKNITDALPDGLMVLDAQAVIVAVNPAFSRITGYQAGELVGRTCSVLDCSACHQLSRQGGCVLQGGLSGETVACRMTHKSGRRLDLWKRASLLLAADGSTLGAVETVIDAAALDAPQPPAQVLIPPEPDERRRLVGRSPAMAALLGALEGLSQGEAPILIQGESGTGKELVARLLHRLGPRAHTPLARLSCAAILPQDLEGAPWSEQAQPKTDLILDEIGDLPPESQDRLARLLARGRPRGVRIFALTNRDLNRMAREGRFERSLWLQLSAVILTVPPLRERREDLPVLVDRLLGDLSLRRGLPQPSLSAPALEMLQAHSWPGNVRELENALEYALILAPGRLIQPAHLPPAVTGSAFPSGPADAGQERQRLVLALRRAGGNQSEAARLLGVSRVTVWKRIQRYGIDPKNLVG